MAEKIIEVDGLSKRYNIGAVTEGPSTIQEQIKDAMVAPFRRIAGLARGDGYAAADLTEEFWALKDVSFDITKGEVVAIIGRNGAGKSTLLRVLSRITEPTSGRAVIHGRVGSLLEVGTGFHPELTGRENVYLNGSIIGMKKAEVDRKFDEIVEFSEAGAFIGTPIKHYSSGMRVRLAFAVAAHLEPEVLFVDEVLAVGDAAFRRKCMDKIRAIGDQGATVLVVSHNAQAIISMCERAIWLKSGTVHDDGLVTETVASYLEENIGLGGEREFNLPVSEDVTRILAVRVVQESGEIGNTVDVREGFYIETEFEVTKPGHGIVLKYDLFNSEGNGVFSAVDTSSSTWEGQFWKPGVYVTRMWVPGNFLQLETYPVGMSLWTWAPTRKREFVMRDVVCVHVVDSKEGDSSAAGFSGVFAGPIRPMMKWDTVEKTQARIVRA